MPAELSIIIVQYKIPELLEQCIASVYEHAGDVSLEVIVVNNDTEDISKGPIMARFPDVVWLDAGYNSGFSRANNIGIRHATGQYLLILNPDTHIKEGFLRYFISFYKSHDTDGKLGLLGCRIISSVDQSLLIGSGIGFPAIDKIIQANPLYIYLTRNRKSAPKKYDPYVMHYRDHEIDFVSGACVMIQREKAIKNNLLFDEDFFLYYEDVEWAHRIQSAGFKNYFCSEIEVYHVNSASTGQSKTKFSQIQISGYLFFLKAYGLLYYLLFGFIQFVNFKLDLYLLKRKGPKEVYAEEKEKYAVFKNYFFQILRRYRSSPTQDRPYLKYEQ